MRRPERDPEQQDKPVAAHSDNFLCEDDQGDAVVGGETGDGDGRAGVGHDALVPVLQYEAEGEALGLSDAVATHAPPMLMALPEKVMFGVGGEKN
jgi:hypothetical protein